MRKRDSQLEPERRRPLLGGMAGIDSVAHFNKIKARFFSEYGFQSFPEYQSVLKYAPEERDHNIYSDVMMAHQRGGQVANSRIEKITADEYRKPKDFPSTLYMSILLQGDAIKTAIEAHRRMMPYNMGSLFWQHNDCWPGRLLVEPRLLRALEGPALFCEESVRGHPDFSHRRKRYAGHIYRLGSPESDKRDS